MGEPEKPEIDVIRPEVEVLPRDHSEPASSTTRSRVWLSVDSQRGTHRVYITKPGPIASFPLALAIGGLMVISFVLALGLFAIVAGVSIVAFVGLLIYGFFRGALSRWR
jgi:hypothetical protein